MRPITFLTLDDVSRALVQLPVRGLGGGRRGRRPEQARGDQGASQGPSGPPRRRRDDAGLKKLGQHSKSWKKQPSTIIFNQEKT